MRKRRKKGEGEMLMVEVMVYGLECSDPCNMWFHRQCAGLAVQQYK